MFDFHDGRHAADVDGTRESRLGRESGGTQETPGHTMGGTQRTGNTVEFSVSN